MSFSPEKLLHGANCWYVSKDNDGMPRLSFNNERTIGVAQRIMSIFGNTEVLYNTHNLPTPDETRINMFLENKGLFSNTNLGAVFSLRNMEADFGILPIPKSDEEQERYYSFSSVYSGGIMMVPKTADNLERTAVVLTALASGSEGVYKAYYEGALKGKVARDEGAADMIAKELLCHDRMEWAVETMHWLLDVHYGEDYCRVENRTIQQNLNLLRKFSISLLKQYKTRASSKRAMSKIMLDCLLDPRYLCAVLEN